MNEASHVLLFRYEDDGGSWWATPGGGLEGNETFEQAAAREAEEELGISDISLEYRWERTSEFESRGQFIRQTERFFLAKFERTQEPVDEDVSDAHAVEGILTTRWWSRDEIVASAERVFPEDLADRLDGLLEPPES